MDADLIIKYVHQHYRHYWRVERGLDCRSFEDLLKPYLAALSPTDYGSMPFRVELDFTSDGW